MAGPHRVAVAWEVLGIDSGPHQYHLTISALAQAYRPLNAALLLVWVLVGLGYQAARVRAPVGASRPCGTKCPDDPEDGTPLAARWVLRGPHAAPALLLPRVRPSASRSGSVPLAAVLIDVAARRRMVGGQRRRVVRFISTSRLANVALIAAWAFAGYHLFAR